MNLNSTFLILLLVSFSYLEAGTTFSVTSTADSGTGSLREAIQNNNGSAPSTGTTNTIAFNIPGSGPFLIQPVTPLPPITQPVLIDGYSQPGAQMNTSPFGNYNGVIKIEINGNAYTTGDLNTSIGLSLTDGADGSTIRGLSLTEWLSQGIKAQSAALSGIQITGNFIGIDPTGTILKANASGIGIFDVDNVIIGGASPSDSNVIVGSIGFFISSNAGISINASDPHNISNFTIQNNLIGVTPNGRAIFAQPNNTALGLLIVGVDGNSGVCVAKDNIISGCIIGALMDNTSNTILENNIIGLDYSATTAIPNLNAGIEIWGGGQQNTIQKNTIAGNGNPTIPYIGGGNGIIIGDTQNDFGAVPTSNTITGNFIGTNSMGASNIGNTGSGIVLIDDGGDTIEQNVISGNGQNGVLIITSSSDIANGNVLNDNIIGLDPTQSFALPNKNGIQLGQAGLANACSNNLISTNNVIAGNSNVGILITSFSNANAIDKQNFFGVNRTGKSFPNAQGDIELISSSQTLFYISE